MANSLTNGLPLPARGKNQLLIKHDSIPIQGRIRPSYKNGRLQDVLNIRVKSKGLVNLKTIASEVKGADVS